uniref:Uncharacterized protein n=1 Tax=Ananas comosus var. bracteatus TaxID=296719 RepID=A0A6V7P0R5_ANACO|nr:unnamed protein product [Ananas comosus var. bracteatus]
MMVALIPVRRIVEVLLELYLGELVFWRWHDTLGICFESSKRIGAEEGWPAGGASNFCWYASGSEASSLPIKLNVDEWFKEIEEKKMICSPTDTLALPFDDKTKPKICKFTLHEEISRPRLVKVGEFPQPSVVTIGPFHRQKSTGISDDEKMDFQ